MLSDNGQDGLVQSPVRGQHAGNGQFQRGSQAVGHPTSGFLDEESAGGEVPRGELVLEEGPELSATDHAEVEGGRAKSSNPVDVLSEQRGDGTKSRLHHRTAIVIKSNANHGLIETIVVSDPNRPAVLERPLSSDCSEPITTDGTEDDATLSDSIAMVGDRNGEMRQVMSEVVGAVKRVDDPKMLGIKVAVARLFLTQNGMTGEGPLQDLDNGALGFEVGIRDQVADVLGAVRDPFPEVT